MSLGLHLKIIGLTLILLAFSHVYFPRRFNWREELGRLSLLNRQIFLVHCFFIALVLLLFGLLSFYFTDALLERTPLARVVLGGQALFWLVRLIVQLFVYDPQLWKGDRFNTLVHFLFSLAWTYYLAVYAWALWKQLGS